MSTVVVVLAAVNVVDAKPLADASAIASGLAQAFPYVYALGAPAVVRKRRAVDHACDLPARMT